MQVGALCNIYRRVAPMVELAIVRPELKLLQGCPGRHYNLFDGTHNIRLLVDWFSILAQLSSQPLVIYSTPS